MDQSDKLTTEYPPREDRPWLTPSEREPGFYNIHYTDVEDPNIGEWSREISWSEAPELGRAIELAEEQHSRALSWRTEPSKIRPTKVGKYWLRRHDQEKILDILWEKRPEEYMDLWEPDISTSEMIAKMRESDPESLEILAQYVHTEYEERL